MFSYLNSQKGLVAPYFFFVCFCFLKILLICLRERECTREIIEVKGEGETDSQLSREPNVGLDPRTLRS